MMYYVIIYNSYLVFMKNRFLFPLFALFEYQTLALYVTVILQVAGS